MKIIYQLLEIFTDEEMESVVEMYNAIKEMNDKEINDYIGESDNMICKFLCGLPITDEGIMIFQCFLGDLLDMKEEEFYEYGMKRETLKNEKIDKLNVCSDEDIVE